MNSFKIPDRNRRTNSHTMICSLIVTCLSNLLLLTGCTTGLQDRQWETVSASGTPTARHEAAFSWNGQIIIGGGESMAQEVAHSQVEAFNSNTGQWMNWPDLNQGRHGSGFAVVGDHVYIASGSGNRGGEPELTTLERLKLPSKNFKAERSEIDSTRVYSQWHTVTLSFDGPETNEIDEDNPFLNYQLNVQFQHTDIQYNIRGLYAADGHAAETGAESGNVWQVRFTPDRTGKWTYSATLYHGDSVSLNQNPDHTLALALADSSGTFLVTPTDKDGPDFRAYGGLKVVNGYFKFGDTGNYWIKGGADSPENFLAYQDFDGTYRIAASSRDGEANTSTEIHSFTPHLQDWRPGDPTWQDNKGKSIIGAINYLASKGMNAVYFIVNNIQGDGKDVWPYRDPGDFTRFDVSKLDQWEMVFQHMQSKGIMLHMVLQETENETMLDGGDTGPLRKLYLNELIARFGHHPGLKWNLGEENGPAPFSPIAQNDQQRHAMATYVKRNDPYQHPVLLHTHSHDPPRAQVLNQILGFKELDGLSLQVGERRTAPSVVREWRNKSIDAGHPWLITMDEIGKWDTGAKPDAEDPQHTTLRRYVLWGTLLSGAAGVEWYFGANNKHNDLTTEDWRTRDRLWELTGYALDFFQNHLPYWHMVPGPELTASNDIYCLYQAGKVYALYYPPSANYAVDLRNTSGNFSVKWYDPLTGGTLKTGSLETVSGGTRARLGSPPKGSLDPRHQDWVVLLKKTNE